MKRTLHRSVPPKAMLVLVAIGLLCLAAPPQRAQAQATGVDDNRVSLPEGPGTLEGVGENVDMDPNMGNMTYAIPINVPAGFGAVTPQLSLNYSSGGGGSVVGMGWSMSTPNIERMTYRGLPEYDAADDFGADGSNQLVLIPGSNPPVYRSRYEKGFVQYTWMNPGSQGYWLAEYPDGSKGYFGATQDGSIVEEARMGGDNGTFRYMLVEKVDVYGHKMIYTYTKFGVVPLVTEIGYVYTTNPNAPTYRVAFDYGERRDGTGVDYLSDAKCGFNELLTQRLERVDVFSREARIRSYVLEYEQYDQSGGFTRLNKVTTIGHEEGEYPAHHAFSYSKAEVCRDGNSACVRPRMVDMGSLGVSLANGFATLIDINGDALPDVVDTSTDGPHQFFINTPRMDGTSVFGEEAILSTTAQGSSFRLGGPGVQVLDADGDGFTDLVNAALGQVLFNKGTGDWLAPENAQGTATLADSLSNDFDATDGELQALRFMDYNNDKLIDLIRADENQTSYLENRGEQGFVLRDEVPALGASFRADGVQLTDMNGDGLQDVVQVNVNQVRYRLNFGWGQWGDWVNVENLVVTDGEVARAELEDLNGDGMSDLVIVDPAGIKYALNKNTTSFTDMVTLSNSSIDGDLPTDDNVTVLYADMNANGSTDIVWIDGDGQVDYLELFPVRPNLLNTIENGLGQVTRITYGSSVQHMARDGGLGAWEYKLPHPMLVVDEVDKYEALTGGYDEQGQPWG
ncbi:MAG: SpvB/TcaC N-terminal domain-containing protein, partial [Myxococcota bacterium]